MLPETGLVDQGRPSAGGGPGGKYGGDSRDEGAEAGMSGVGIGAGGNGCRSPGSRNEAGGPMPDVLDLTPWICWCRWPGALPAPQGLAEAQHLTAFLSRSPQPPTPGPTPGLSTGPNKPSLAAGSGLDQPPEKTAEAGKSMGWGGASPDPDSHRVLGPFNAFPWTQLLLLSFTF